MKDDYVAVWYRKKGNKLELISKDEFKALKKRFDPLIGDDFEDVYAIYMIEHERYEGIEEDKFEMVFNQGDYMEIFEDAFEDSIVMRIYRDRNDKSFVWRYHHDNQWVKPLQPISEMYLFEKNHIDFRDVLKLSYPYNYIFFDKDQVIHQTNVDEEKNRWKKNPSMTTFLSLKINVADFEDAFYTPKSRRSKRPRKSRKSRKPTN